jgi:CheY-like chemotaxis protein
MPALSDDHPLLTTLDAPAAVCSSDGRLDAWNHAFATWVGAPSEALGRARVDVYARRALLLVEGQHARNLHVTPLAEGGWLGLASSSDAPDAAAAVGIAIARRLHRLETSIAANASMGIMEQPDEPVAACLRELLAASQELRVLARQVESLAGAAGAATAPPDAVCLRALVREALAVLPPGSPFVIERTDGDVTVAASQARLLTHVVALLQSLVGYLAPGGTIRIRALSGSSADKPGTHVPIGSAGDTVTLVLALHGATAPIDAEPAIEDARAFAASHGGRLLIDGERVLVALPCFAASPVGAVRAHGGAPVEQAPLGTVLIVDDDESTLAMMGAVLRRSGWTVLSAENGVAASVLLRQHAPEIVAIVADAVLPGRSGVELAAEARRIAPRLPVLLVSGHPSDLIGDRGLRDVPLLSKPFGARALAERVRRLVEHDDV